MNLKLSFIGKELRLALVIVVVMLLPRIFELNKFVTTDETIWIMRSSNFYYALGQREFENTYQGGGNAGVVTMWVGSVAYLIEFPEYRGFGQGYFENFRVFDDFLGEISLDPMAIVTTSRVVMVILLSVVIGLAFVITKRMIGLYPAIIGFLLISFDPWYLALSRISHTDAPQATFQLLSLLAFLSFFYFEKKPVMLFLSGIAGGIAFLAKLPGLLVAPTIALLSFIKFLKSVIIDKPKGLLAYLGAGRNYVKTLVIWTLFFLIAAVMFFPYSWTNPVRQIKRMVSSPINRVTKLDYRPALTDIFEEDSGGISSLSYYYRYPLDFLRQTTPVVLLGLAASAVAYVKRRQILKDQGVRNVVSGLFWFVVIYTVIMTIPAKTSPRYYLVAHLALDLIAGIGLVALGSELQARLTLDRNKLISQALVAALVGLHIAGAVSTFPYYFSYYNPLLGGSKKAGETLYLGQGEGLNEAGEYLNAKPNADQLTVLSWYGIGPLSFFFDGRVENFVIGNKWIDEDWEFLFGEVDYVVTYTNQWYRRFPQNLLMVLDDIEPEYTVWINEIEYARVYSVTAIASSMSD